MSLLSSFVATHLIPLLEQELVSNAPEVQAFLLKNIKELSASVGEWAETKLNVDLNGDGKIGGEQ